MPDKPMNADEGCVSSRNFDGIGYNITIEGGIHMLTNVPWGATDKFTIEELEVWLVE